MERQVYPTPVTPPALTPLEPWIAAKTGSSARPLDSDVLRAYQLDRLNDTLCLVRKQSRFYQRRLRDFPERLSSLDEVAALPFTTAHDLRAAPFDFLCVRQDNVSRIVTLPTSGTTGAPKRIFFTAHDQELTRDFFQVGMSTLVAPGDRVLVLLPGTAPGSVGTLLGEGLARMGVQALVHGPVGDPEAALQAMAEWQPTAMVGIPVQVLELALLSQAYAPEVGTEIHSLLLSTDRVPPPLARTLENVWGCRVFNHYGMTEMGFGGGVDCQALAGYHLREADMLFEIIDPITGLPQPDGETGELVFTTLTREAMPLIRYRTGDLTRFIPDPCPCGTVLRRLEHVHCRLADGIDLLSGKLHQGDLDDRLFTLEGVADFRTAFACHSGVNVLSVEIRAAAGYPQPPEDEVMQSLLAIPVLAAEAAAGRLRLEIAAWTGDVARGTGIGKRRIGVQYH